MQHLQRCSSAGLCSELANGSSNRHIADQTTAIPLVGLGGHARTPLCWHAIRLCDARIQRPLGASAARAVVLQSLAAASGWVPHRAGSRGAESQAWRRRRRGRARAPPRRRPARCAGALEFLGEAGVDGRESQRVVPGQDDRAPDVVGGAHRHGVVAATAQERAVSALGDGRVLLAGIEEQLGVLAAGQILAGVKQPYLAFCSACQVFSNTVRLS